MSTPQPLRDRAIQLSEFMAMLDSIRAGAGEMPEQYRFVLAHELGQLANELAHHAPREFGMRGTSTISDPFGHRLLPSNVIGTAPSNGRGEVLKVFPTGSAEAEAPVHGVGSSLAERPDTISATATVSDPVPLPTDAGKTRLKLMGFLMARSNTQASVKEMVQKTGATQGSITTILYKRNFGQFEKCGSVPSGAAPQVLWRLTQKGIDEYNRIRGDDRPTPPETGP